MPKISFSDAIGVVGIILAMVLLVLDKAERIRGGWLQGLLAVAGIMTLFIAIGNSWVLDAALGWRLWRGAFMIAAVGLTYSGLAILISGNQQGKKESQTRLSSTRDAIEITDPETREKIQKLVKEIYRAKAATLELQELYEARLARDRLRNKVEEIEKRHGCLIEMEKLECLPKPPSHIDRTELEMNVSAIVVADELSTTRFWVIRKSNRFKFRVPIVLFLSLRNNQRYPVKIDLLYLEASSSRPDNWLDIRMADSLIHPTDAKTMESDPLVLQSDDNYGQMKGEYLVPSLYNRLIQPGENIAGWIIAEYPRGIKYGKLIGTIRASVLADSKQWISTKTFAAHPAVYPTEDGGPIVERSNNGGVGVIQPLDFFIDED